MSGTAPEDTKKKKKRLIIYIAALILLIATSSVFLAVHLANRDLRKTAEVPSQGSLLPPGFAANGPLTGMSAEELRKQMQMAADASYFAFKINARPVFASGGDKGDLRIENPSYNVYPMVVQIFLDDTEEMVFDSGGILPNQHIDRANLDTKLAPGTYNATAYMNAYDPESLTWLGKQAAALVLTVNA